MCREKTQAPAPWGPGNTRPGKTGRGTGPGDRSRGRLRHTEGYRVRRETVNGLPLIRFEALSLPGVVHAVTTRAGGVSRGPFATLNLGLHTNDETANVLTNRRRVCDALNINLESWVCAEQVHGGTVAVVGAEDRGRGAVSYERAIPQTDALITATPGLTLATFSADCPLVGLVDPSVPAVGLAHASWRSTVAGITARTVARMVETFGCRPARTRAVIAPSAGPCCYEVGEEVRAAARETLTDADRFFERRAVAHPVPRPVLPGRAFPDPQAATRGRADSRLPPSDSRLYFDLWSANVAQLEEAGVRRENIEVAGVCSICHRDAFFSYRTARGPVGHIAFLLGLTAP